MHLTDLFYYDPAEKKHGELQKGLKEYQFLLKAGILAIEHLQQGNLEKFDSLVGENACQIRAIKIALIASNDLERYVLCKQKLKTALEITTTLLVPSSIKMLMQNGPSLREVIDQNNIDIAISSEEMFVITAFILAEMKELKKIANKEFCHLTICERSVPNKLEIPNYPVSPSFKNNLARRARRLLSQASVNFAKKVAFHLSNPYLLKMMTDHANEHNSLPCTPMFWTYKTLLSYAQEKELPLVFHAKFLNNREDEFHVVREEYLYFKPCKITKAYSAFIPDENMEMTPACVIQGAVCVDPYFSATEWKERMLQYSAIDIILAGAADHRQYPNPEQTVEIFDEEYEHFKALAKKSGFSIHNPSTFFIQHVYSSNLAIKSSQKVEISDSANTS